MREVSCKATRTILEALEEAGVPIKPIVAGLPVSLDELRAPGGRVDWDAFAVFCERVEEACATANVSLEDLGRRMLRVPSFDFLRHASRLLVSPRQLYVLANRLVAPAMFSCVVVRLSFGPAGRLLVTGELLPGHRECAAFFRICHANVAATPLLLDLPASVIAEQQISGRHGRMSLVLPRSHTLVARLYRGGRALRYIAGAWRDVARQQVELETSMAALRTSRHDQRQLLERLPEGVLVHRGGVVCWANATALASLGHERLEEVVGRHVLAFLPVEDRAAVAEQMARALPNQVTDERVAYRVLRPDGTVRLLQSGTVQNVEFEGGPARLVVMRDITEHRRLEQQLALAERMASMGALAAGVAHEINNPLAYAHSSLEVASRELAQLADPVRTAGIAEALARAREGTARVRGIVRDLKTLSRGEDDGPFEAVDLPTLLDSTLALAASATSARARLVRSYGPVPRARATQARLGQVFLNLLLNAAEALPEGAPGRHEIRVSTSTDALGRAVVEIADTGSGIAPALAGRVFDPFFTTKPVGEGTGLGLAICHRLITRLGGTITFTSQPGAGTSFRITLPSVQGLAEAVTAPEPARVPAGRGRVLVVDDEQALLRSVSDLLGEVHEVVTASSGRQALEVLREDRGFDVVLADLMMADVTGMDLYEAVCTSNPVLARRFVFMTGGAFTARGRAFLADVPNVCLEKPFDADELLATLGQVLARSESEMALPVTPGV
ncbi:MAG: uncharacterized protein H6Q90_2490 [Deltaproteobacteria bacterium]|nr:uncharacterized protein [Deltaproteobacteria bacterium]